MLASGIGGGPPELSTGAPSPGFFFGGGGGAFLAGDKVLSSINIGPSSCSGSTCLLEPPWDTTLSSSPYFEFISFADFRPEATCVPCRSLKLLNVDAAFRASEKDTDDGLSLNEDAVFNADCFSAQVVPCAAGSLGEEVRIWEKRDCSAFT